MPYIFDPARYAGFPAHQTRAQVSAEIERMIDFLDAMDPWDEREDENEHGDPLEGRYGEGDECEDREPDDDAEGLVWTEAVNQDSSARLGGDGWYRDEDSEPELGFCIPGAGWTGGANDGREGDDEREIDGDEADYSGHEDEGIARDYDGTGVWIGKGMVRAARMIRAKQMVAHHG